MTRATTIASRLALLETRLGSETFTLLNGDTSYPCCASTLHGTDELDAEGNEDRASLQLHVRVEALGELDLNEGDHLTFRDRDWTIVAIDETENTFLVLRLADASSNA